GDLEGHAVVSAGAAVGPLLVSRPAASRDPAAVASAAIESVAENLTDSVLAPLLFYAGFGLPGAAVYRAVNTADAMFGYRRDELEDFGKVPARLDDALNLVPAPLAGLLLVVAAAVTRGSPIGALRTMWRQHARTASPNAGWTMAAMAGALGVTLAKVDHYRLGDGRLPVADDVRLAVRTMATAALITAGLLTIALGILR